MLINFGKNNPTEREWKIIDGIKLVEKKGLLKRRGKGKLKEMTI